MEVAREVDMIVLGFSGIRNGEYYRKKYGLRFVGHDSAVALVQDGKVLFAAEEERFSREKHTSCFPVGALQAALESERLSLNDLHVLAYPWKVTPARFLHMNWYHGPRVPIADAPELALTGIRVIRDLMSPKRIASQFELALGQRLPKCRGVSHHVGHVACAYYPSPFERAAVLTVDGQGEDESGTLGEWEGTRYRHFKSVYSPNSIGILYGMVTDFLGMRAGWDEYKVMGMSAYGDASRFRNVFRRLVTPILGGRYRTYRTAMVFKPGYCDQMLSRLLGVPPRKPADSLKPIHFDLAACLQETTEGIIFHMLKHLRERSTARNLCLAGGVFQNSVINGKIRQSGLFEKVFVPPVPGDSGGALGAALHVYHKSTNAPRQDIEFTVFSGPEYSEKRMEAALQSADDKICFHRSHDVTSEAAQLLCENRILSWFQGRMEYGPRALGHRSILASPTRADMKDLVNRRIKHREEYRPFAGSVPLEDASSFFELTGSSPHMQFVVPVRGTAQDKIPAIVHFGTCRVQTVSKEVDPLYHHLLTEFGNRTGVSVLMNTSFNDADEPIVCSPEDAVASFLRMELDAMVMGPFVIQWRRPDAARRTQ